VKLNILILFKVGELKIVNLKQIETFFSDYKFEENVLNLDVCTKITDLKNYVETQIHLLKSNSGNRSYLPYYNRLLKVYLKINDK
jgi:hypothetical protein